MKEFLKLIWRLRMFTDQRLYLTDGREIEIISTGIPCAEGVEAPEFFSSAFRILDENIDFHGSIKIDINSVDWYYQKTVASAQFDNVVLHVVTHADAVIMLNNHIVPTLVLSVPDQLLDYRHVLSSHCKSKLSEVAEVYSENFVARLTTDRIERKSKDVIDILNSVEKNWARTTLIMIMRSFGYGDTKDAFEKLARNLSMYLLCNNCSDLQSLEALLFGHSGHLSKQYSEDPYYFDLQQRYAKLCEQYKIPTFNISWHTSQVRPRSIAELQIARVAAVFYNNATMFDQLLTVRDYNKLRKIFEAQLSPYWQTHSALGVACKVGLNQVTSDKVDLIFINGVVPLLYAYGAVSKDTKLQEWALDLLTMINAERNSKVKVFESEGYIVASAYYSQALIQMYDVYCSKGLCEKCPLGSHLLNLRYKLYLKVKAEGDL